MYSQKNPLWANLEIIQGLTMGKAGCFITSLACLDGRTPDTILKILKQNHALNHEGALISILASKALGLVYNGITQVAQTKPCIAETDHYFKVGYPQHFFVWLGDGTIFDVLDGKKEANKYHIVSYRLFEPKQGIVL